MKRSVNVSARVRASLVIGLMLAFLVEGCGPGESTPPPASGGGTPVPATSDADSKKKGGGPATRRDLQKERRAKGEGKAQP